MRIRDYLTPDRIDLGLDSATKAQAIERLVLRLAGSLGLPDPQAVLSEVNRREEILSTGVGDGIAIPHAGIGVPAPAIALGVARAGIDYGALDQKPVHVLFLLVWPSDQPGLQLKALARIARLGRQEDLVTRLTHAKTPADALAVIVALDERADQEAVPRSPATPSP